MPLKQRGFSLIEVLIAMVIGSILLLSTSRFLPAMQRSVLVLSGTRSWKRRSGSAFSLWVSSSSAPDTVQVAAREKGC